MINDSEYPWVFRRDEIDLLEEDLDALFDFHAFEEGRIETVEQAILQEHLQTEERADQEWVQNAEIAWLIHPPQEGGKRRESESLDTARLAQETERPPLYEEVFRFGEGLARYAKQQYRQHDPEDDEHFFRVLVNAKILPIKYANAIMSELQEERSAREIAKKEYRLAMTYLERILFSLAFLASGDYDEARGFLPTGASLMRAFEIALQRLERSEGFSYE